jgi:hypothetical protein
MVLCKKHKKEDHGPDQSRQKSKILFKADNWSKIAKAKKDWQHDLSSRTPA